MIHTKQIVTFRRVLILVLCVVLFWAMSAWAQNQPFASKAEQAKTLIVRVDAKNSFGAGILFSLRGGYLFIATANHVVKGSLDGVEVKFEFLRGVAVQAELWNAYPKLDLAVLRVDIQKSRLRNVKVEAIPFDLLGKVVTLQHEDVVYPVGHPEGIAWDVPLTPTIVKKVVAEEISFEPACFAGHSGGGLFDANWTLVGMITRTLGRSCEAISFERICATLEDDWGLVVSHEPLPPIDEQRQQHIQDLLEQAESYFTLQWYITPAETNAFDVYRQVLQLDPGNQQAVQKIQQMLAFYKSRAEQAEQQGNTQKAIQYYQRYLKIAPNDDDVLDKLLQLQPPPSPQTIPTSTPNLRPTALPIAIATPVPQKTPRVTLRSTSFILSEDDARKAFGLDKSGRPLNYIDNDFEAQGDVVIDHATGLRWQQSGSETYLTYEKAKDYIQRLNRQKFLGYTDWRLPTLPELMSLLEPEESSNGLYIHQIFNNHQAWCWTDKKFSSGSVWYINFKLGIAYWSHLVVNHYVRAVRSGQIQTSNPIQTPTPIL